MDKFEGIQAFVAVVDAGSFTAAAERVNAAKSGLSRRVAALEERLGVQLLQRTTRVLKLTDSGRGFYEQARQILSDLDEAEAGVQQRGELRGMLRIALPLSFGVRHMARLIAAFNKRHPEVEFDLVLNDRRVDPTEENFDIALHIGQPADSSLNARHLFESRSIVVASPHYLAANGTPATPQELAEHRCLTLSGEQSSNAWLYRDGDGKALPVKVKSTFRASSVDLLCNAAAQGMGLTVQPTFVAAQAIRSGNLVPVLTEFEWPSVATIALYPPARQLSHRVQAFVDFLAERFSGRPQWDKDCFPVS